MIIKNTYILALGVSIIIQACGKEEEKPVYFGCCGNPAINEPVGNGHVYIPNIFTPDDDGINDLLIVFGDSIQRIIRLEIRNSENMIIFEANNLLPNIPEVSWDGQTDGVTQKGMYSLTTEIEAMDGTIRIFESEICNHPCSMPGTDENEPITLSNCQFPTQGDDGHFGTTFPSGEANDCFQ